jgi:hypothetical protein
MSDPEIDAMSAVATALADLEEDQRGRVLRWAAERYSVALPKGRVGRGSSSGGAEDSGGDDEGLTEDEITSEDPDFADFGDLFAAADPKTNEDKALVAAYWRQVHEGEEKWQATALQKDLRNLGHAIPNITDALTSNIRKRPQRVIQVQKSGSARQARKTYKVTREGFVYVQGMLGHGG